MLRDTEGMDSVQIVTLEEAARILKVHKVTVTRWVAEGKAPEPLRIGGAGRRPAILTFYRREIEELIRARKAGIIK